MKIVSIVIVALGVFFSAWAAGGIVESGIMGDIVLYLHDLPYGLGFPIYMLMLLPILAIVVLPAGVALFLACKVWE